MSSHGDEPDGRSWGVSGDEESSERYQPPGAEQPLNDPPTVELGLPREQPAEDPDPHYESEPFAAAEQGAEAESVPAAQQPAFAQQPESGAGVGGSGAGFAEELDRPLAPEPSQDPPAKERQTDFKPLAPTQGGWGDSTPAAPPAQNGTLQSNGAGAPANVSAPGALARDSIWQRPESTLAVAFLAGVLLAGLIKRRRSR